MDVELVKQGYWWLPGTSDQRVPGRLVFDALDGARLELIGCLDHPFKPGSGDRSQLGEYGTVFGEAGGDYFTLLDCFRSHLRGQLLTGTAVETVYVNIALEGLHFDEGDVIGGSGLSATMRHLPHWLAMPGLDRRYADREDPSDTWAVLEARRLATIAVELPGGGNLQIKQLLSTGGDDVVEATVRQTFTVKVSTPDITPLDELIKLLGTFQHLVSIGADDPAAFDEVYLWHPDAERHGEPFGARVHAQWSDRPKEIKLKPSQEMAFTWRHIRADDALARWMEVGSRFRGPLQRVMASRSRPGLFLDDRLLHRSAALEAFDRTRSGKRNSAFKTRLNRCVHLAGEPFMGLVGDAEMWSEAMRVERDEVAHQFGQTIPDSARLLFLSESAYWLFVLCMLREAAMPSPVFDGVTSSPGWRWVNDNVRNVLGL